MFDDHEVTDDGTSTAGCGCSITKDAYGMCQDLTDGLAAYWFIRLVHKARRNGIPGPAGQGLADAAVGYRRASALRKIIHNAFMPWPPRNPTAPPVR